MPRNTQAVDETTLADHHASTSAALMKAALEEKLIRSGKYITKVKAKYDKTGADDAEYDAGRRTVSLAVEFSTVADPATVIGRTFIKTSPEARYTKKGTLDNAANRYVELAKSIGVSGNDADETYEKADQVAFMTKVREVYRVPADELHESHADARVNDSGEAWITLEPEADEAREYYTSLGLEPSVMVDRIYKLKV